MRPAEGTSAEDAADVRGAQAGIRRGRGAVHAPASRCLLDLPADRPMAIHSPSLRAMRLPRISDLSAGHTDQGIAMDAADRGAAADNITSKHWIVLFNQN